jgi:hypothetical protein
MQQLIRQWLDFNEICYLSVFKKSAGKIQASLKSDKDKGYFTGDQYTFFIISLSALLRIKMFQANVVEKLETHILCSVTFVRKSYRLWIMWKIIVESGRPQMTIWLVRNACWIPKATHIYTHTHRLCNTHYYSTSTMVARTPLKVTLCVACLSC